MTPEFSARRTRWGSLFIGCAVAAIPALLYGGLVLHHFYLQGAYLWDSGFVAGLLWHGDPALTTPSIYGGGSFLAVHMAPLDSLMAVMSWLVPISAPQWFALVIGIGHALPAVGVYWALRSGFGLKTIPQMGIAAGLALAFAFSGIPLATIRFPHLEILEAGALILFAAAFALDRRSWTIGFLVLALSTREDAGLHIAALMVTLAGMQAMTGAPRRDLGRALLFAGLGVTGSVAALLAGHLAFPTSPSAFSRIYIGDPPFAHVTEALLLDRLAGMPSLRGYVILPAVSAAIWAILIRSPLPLAGYVAALPWFGLQILAVSNVAGTLSGYYAFPFLLAAFWPLAAQIILDRRRGHGSAFNRVGLGFAAILAPAFISIGAQWNPGQLDLIQGFTDPPGLARQAATDRAVAALIEQRTALGRLAVDGSVMALAPYAFGADQNVVHGDEGPVDTIVYFANGYEATAAEARIEAERLPPARPIPGTELRIARREVPAASPK
jgi:hypothetical protein